jgi:hypothetical protein
MNERIQELAVQVYGSAATAQEIKFAELIVQKCADVLLEWKKEPFPLDPDFAASLIKEHFGIKE